MIGRLSLPATLGLVWAVAMIGAIVGHAVVSDADVRTYLDRRDREAAKSELGWNLRTWRDRLSRSHFAPVWRGFPEIASPSPLWDDATRIREGYRLALTWAAPPPPAFFTTPVVSSTTMPLTIVQTGASYCMPTATYGTVWVHNE